MMLRADFVSLDEILDKMPSERRARIAAMTAELAAEEKSLRDLRKAHALTQEQVARALDVKQVNVSQLEKRSDFLLSTLRSYIEAMGGTLELVAHFPGRQPVRLKGMGDISQTAPRKETKRLCLAADE